MSEFVIVESRDPFDSVDVEFTRSTAVELAAKGHRVTVYLIQNGVLPLRKRSSKATFVEDLQKNKVIVWADDFSLKERGIASSELVAGVETVSIDRFVKKVVEDKPKTFWH